ncbi:hypothetical protein PPACK8108_LOCUS22343 [Phakopsora pachyrhizi]|uniref:Pre-mRNA polyadenylation factor Fip1 domain-containing protein n=1 Tax=Phakopsora pachyrhizi TaxID=170000 RepID=A0AAV0BNF7_PHAPC|nr:hypothetical protein PPACK8108_LOCUS22343 [Phakopsora pachyrhizi]
MDDDDAFLYGDDAPDENITSEKFSIKPVETIHQTQGVKSETLLLGLPESFHSTSDSTLGDPIGSLRTAPEQAIIPEKTTTILTEVLKVEIQASTITPEVVNPVNDSEQDAEAESDDGEGQEEEEEDDDDDDDDGDGESEDDLDIILEGNSSQIAIAPPPRQILPVPRTDNIRDQPKQSIKILDQPNVTTEYKPLERTDFKPLEGTLPNELFTTASPSKSNPQQHNHSNLNTHNRLPTPEIFPRPNTPPTVAVSDTNPPDLEATQNPTVRSGYDDKDGTALMDFDFDGIPDDEKGWKKPGAHLADWFNYGFDETTWRLYVMKQKRLRKDHGRPVNPFANFATGNIQQAWDELPADLRTVMMQTIMGNSSGPSVNNNINQRPMQPMMVMNPMMQSMDMGGFGIQGMQNMMGGGNQPMSGGMNNTSMSSQLNDDLSRGIKQDPTGASENNGDMSAHYGDEIDSREQQHHDQQRMQEQMRHMQHMQHMGMNPGFMGGMDLAAMFGNQEHQMFMNGPQFNGMMEMPQMAPHMQHIPQMVGGNRTMNMSISQGMNSGVNPGGINVAMGNQPVGPVGQTPGIVGTPGVHGGPIGGLVNSPGPIGGQLGSINIQGSVGTQAAVATSSASSLHSPIVAPVPGSNTHASTPNDSPRTPGAGVAANGRGRVRGGRGRGNAQASAFLAAAAAAARGRGRAISVSNSTPPLVPVSTSASPSQTVEATSQAVPSVPGSVSPAPQTSEKSKSLISISFPPLSVNIRIFTICFILFDHIAPPPTERPTTAKTVSPLPSNVPTGPRRAAIAAAPSRGPRATPGGYFDKDAAGGRGDEGLDYGGGGGGGGGVGGESPRDDRKSASSGSRKHSHRGGEREEDPRAADRNEERSVRSRSKSRDKETDEKESSHRSSRSKHRHRARSRSKEADHRSSNRDSKGEKDNKEEGGGSHKGSRSGGSRRSRRNRRNVEGDEKNEERDGSGLGDDRDRESHRDKDKEGRSKNDDDQDGDYSIPATNGSRKRKSKEDRSNRSKRERGE